MPLMFQLFKKKLTSYDVTIFQTPCFGEDKGYEMVYRTEINGRTHEDVLERSFPLLMFMTRCRMIIGRDFLQQATSF